MDSMTKAISDEQFDFNAGVIGAFYRGLRLPGAYINKDKQSYNFDDTPSFIRNVKHDCGISGKVVA